MLQADKSVSTTRWPRRASSVIAVDLPVPDIPVIRTWVTPSNLPRQLYRRPHAVLIGSSEATGKRAPGNRSGSGNDTVGAPRCPQAAAPPALCPEAQARSRTMASASGRKPTSVK